MKPRIAFLASFLTLAILGTAQTTFGTNAEVGLDSNSVTQKTLRETCIMKVNAETGDFDLDVNLIPVLSHVINRDTLLAHVRQFDMHIDAQLPITGVDLQNAYPIERTYDLKGMATVDGRSIPVSFSLALTAQSGVVNELNLDNEIYPYYASLIVELPLDQLPFAATANPPTKSVFVEIRNGILNQSNAAFSQNTKQ